MVAATWLGLLVAACYGTSDFLGGLLSRRTRLIDVLVGAQATMAVLALGALLVSPPPAGVAGWGWGLAAGVAQAGAVAALFRGLALGRMGVVAPLSALAVVVPVSVGLANGDSLSAPLAGGLAAAVVGAILAGGPEVRPSEGSPGSRSAIGYAFLAALGFGCSQVLLARGAAVHVPSTLAGTAGAALVLYGTVWLVLAVRRRVRTAPVEPSRMRGPILVGVVAIGVLNFTANTVFGLSSIVAPLSVLAVLAALYPLVTAGLARVVLRERLRPIQFAGIALVVAGLVVMVAVSPR